MSIGCEGGSTYNASKGGVILLTKNLANDYGRLGIRANAICPGFIRTPMFEATVSLMGERAEKIKDQHKLGRWGEASEIAGAAYFLVSDDSSFVTHDIDEAIILADRVLVMGSQPGRVVSDLPVNLPRDRSSETTLLPEFLRLRKTCLDLIKAQTMSSFRS